MKKKVIFWDFDGVIADSGDFVFDYWKKALGEAGHAFTEADFEATFDVKMPFDYLRDRYGDLARKITENYTEYERHFYANLVELFPQMKPLLTELSGNHDFFIVSANLQYTIEKTLKKNAIKNCFDQVVGRDTAGHKDEKIEKICQENGYHKEACIFIGDTVSDMNHAQSAGLDSVAVTWGVHSREKLEAMEPTFVVDCPEDLFNLLKK